MGEFKLQYLNSLHNWSYDTLTNYVIMSIISGFEGKYEETFFVGILIIWK